MRLILCEFAGSEVSFRSVLSLHGRGMVHSFDWRLIKGAALADLWRLSISYGALRLEERGCGWVVD